MMIERLAQIARPVLEWSMIRRTRRNHGLEHATIHILTDQVKGVRLAGRSSDSGFVVFGDVPTEALESAVHEALRRMRNGEHRLAIHPNCGTNLVTAGGLTTLVALAGLRSTDNKSVMERLPLIMTLMMLAVLFSQPLGMSLQEHFTTEGDPGDLELVSVIRHTMQFPFGDQPVTVHNVITRQS
jgi:hypothetical protein